MIWSDIGIYTRDYNNGMKKVDVYNEAIKKQNEKLKHKTTAFNTHPKVDEHGWDKYTIRSLKFHHNQSFKDLFTNKTTISSTLKGGQLNLSNGTKEIIKMTNRMIPKIDYSGVDPNIN